MIDRLHIHKCIALANEILHQGMFINVHKAHTHGACIS